MFFTYKRHSLFSIRKQLLILSIVLQSSRRSETSSCIPVTSAPVTAYFTCAEMMTLYLDGRYILQHGNYAFSLGVNVPPGSRVLAISCYGTRQRGILGSLDNDVVTDCGWKCTGSLEDNWQGVEFDDSSWPNAIERARNDAGVWPTVSNIAKNAKWIWTDANSANHSTVYCRRMVVNTQVHKQRSSLALCPEEDMGDYCRTIVGGYISKLAFRDHALLNHTFCSTCVSDVTSCFRLCLWHENCRSFNFRYSSDQEGKSLCEMNNSTEEESPQHFLYKHGFTYYDGSVFN